MPYLYLGLTIILYLKNLFKVKLFSLFSDKMSNKTTNLALFFIILFHLFFILLSAHQLYYGDETFFVTAAR